MLINFDCNSTSMPEPAAEINCEASFCEIIKKLANGIVLKVLDTAAEHATYIF